MDLCYGVVTFYIFVCNYVITKILKNVLKGRAERMTKKNDRQREEIAKLLRTTRTFQSRTELYEKVVERVIHGRRGFGGVYITFQSFVKILSEFPIEERIAGGEVEVRLKEINPIPQTLLLYK